MDSVDRFRTETSYLAVNSSMGPEEAIQCLSEIPEFYRDIPILALGPTTRAVLGHGLDVTMTVIVSDQPPGDYRGLAELLGVDTLAMLGMERERHPTLELLSTWIGPDATLHRLCQLLLQLGRLDVLAKARLHFNRDAERWKKKTTGNEYFRKADTEEQESCLKMVMLDEEENHDNSVIGAGNVPNPADSITLLKKQARGENRVMNGKSSLPCIDRNCNVVGRRRSNHNASEICRSCDTSRDMCDNKAPVRCNYYSSNSRTCVGRKLDNGTMCQRTIADNAKGRASISCHADHGLNTGAVVSGELKEAEFLEDFSDQLNGTLTRATRERTAFKQKKLSSRQTSHHDNASNFRGSFLSENSADYSKAAESSSSKNCRTSEHLQAPNNSNGVVPMPGMNACSENRQCVCLLSEVDGRRESPSRSRSGGHGVANGHTSASEVPQQTSGELSTRRQHGSKKHRRWRDMCHVRKWCKFKMAPSTELEPQHDKLSERLSRGVLSGQSPEHSGAERARGENDGRGRVPPHGDSWCPACGGEASPTDGQTRQTSAPTGTVPEGTKPQKAAGDVLCSGREAREGGGRLPKGRHENSPCLCRSRPARQLQALVGKVGRNRHSSDEATDTGCEGCGGGMLQDRATSGLLETARAPLSPEQRESKSIQNSNCQAMASSLDQTRTDDKNKVQRVTTSSSNVNDLPRCASTDVTDANAGAIRAVNSLQDGVTSTSGNTNVAPSPRALHLMNYLSVDDVTSGRETRYDAYLNCADADVAVAKEVLSHLEAAPYSLRFFLPARQLLPGLAQFESMAEVVERRCCGKVVILVTENYEATEACQFITHFARLLDPAAVRKQLVPVLMPRSRVPRLLRGVYHVDFQRDLRRGWLWDKLYTAIRA